MEVGDASSNAKRSRSEDSRGMLSQLVKKVSSNNADLNKSKPLVNKVGTTTTDSGNNLSQSSEGTAYHVFEFLTNTGHLILIFGVFHSCNVDSRKNKRILWADHKGKDLIESRVLAPTDEMDVQGSFEEKTSGDMSWSDRNKRDRLREKELFEQAK